MADRRGTRPLRDVRVCDLHPLLEFIGKRPQPTAQDNRHAGPHGRPPLDVFARFLDVRRVHSSIPAMHADMKLAMVPASIAFRPSRARSDLRVGASAPIPPTWIAIELKLAKPQRAYVAIVKDRGSRVALI